MAGAAWRRAAIRKWVETQDPVAAWRHAVIGARRARPDTREAVLQAKIRFAAADDRLAVLLGADLDLRRAVVHLDDLPRHGDLAVRQRHPAEGHLEALEAVRPA